MKAPDFLRNRRAEMAAALLCFSTSIAGASAIPSRADYLVLDSRVIERVDHANLRVGTVTKDPHNPLFREDKPWEVRYDNVYANVIFDREANLYKCWYNPFIVDELTRGTPPEKRGEVKYGGTPAREMGLCYAVSRDGIRWEKPDLGVIDFLGSTANNLVWRGQHGAGIMKDSVEKDPARRYKLISGEQIPGKPRRFQVAFSPDGIHWSQPQIVSDLGEGFVGDTHNNALWVPGLSAYVGITRLMTGQQLVPPRMRGERLVMRTESRDFIHWTKAVEVLRGTAENQTYAMPIFPYAGVYLGLVMIFNLPTDRVDCELAWSPDTIRWQRIDPGHALIPNSTRPGDYDWGCVYAAAVPVVLPSEIRLYYGSSDGPHSTWRNGFFSLARLRPDRFAGYVAGDEEGVVETKAVAMAAKSIWINADAAKGEVFAELLTEQGGPIEGCSAPDAIPCRGRDGLRLELRWKDRGGRRLPGLEGRAVRVRFHLRRATLYSFATR